MQAIPKFQEIYDDVKADLESGLGITIPIIGKSIIRIIALAQAAKLKNIYLGIASIQKNIFADTADLESAGGSLNRWGRAKLGRDPDVATQGVYTATITGSIGAVVKASTTFKSNPTVQNPGYLFVLDTAYTLVATTDTITLRALTAGVESKLIVGDTLTATEPIVNVNPGAVIAGITTAPRAAEDIEDYRAKILEAFRLEPQGGAASDYILWASDAQGVLHSYPYAKSGAPGEIDLFIEATEADSTDGKGTPTPTILAEVEDVIELDPDTSLPLAERGRRPLGVYAVNVLPITPLDVDITINGFVDLTVDKQAAIDAALKEHVQNIRPFIDGADAAQDRHDQLSVNSITYAIIDALPGSIFTSIDLVVNSVPTSAQVFSQGNIPYLNSITYA